MSKGFSMKLTAEQQKVKDNFLTFLFNNEKYMIIDGKGGTGKTFLLSSLVKSLNNEAVDLAKILGKTLPFKVYAITATTNKACDVLKNYYKDTECDIQTIYSLLNLKVKQNYDTGEQKIVPKGTSQYIIENAVIFIDECSMIDSTLLSYIDKGTFNCKIILIGDKCQLPPVRESISPIYTLGSTEENLTEIQRTEKEDLLEMNQKLRDGVINKSQVNIKCSENIIYLDNQDTKLLTGLRTISRTKIETAIFSAIPMMQQLNIPMQSD